MNILYVFTDQQYAGAMSCAGNDHLRTPAMDRLAAEGVRFANAYCAFPLCSPSRASMFSGLWPHQCGVRFNEQSMTPEARDGGIGNVLARAGYDCAYGGKWHIPWCSPMEDGHGFECINAFDDNRLAGDVIDFLKRGRDRPFFAVASFDNPHNICEYGQGRALAWGPVPTPESLADCPLPPPNHAPSPYEPPCVRTVRRDDYSPDDWRRYLWAYYRLIEKVDAEIGRILDALDELGLTPNTLVVFSSDHGDMMGAHRMVHKMPLYEEATKVPFLARLPGVIEGGRTESRPISAGINLYPTICEFAGIALPRRMPGSSLRPLLAGDESVSWPDQVISETRMGRNGVQGRMVRTARHKYIAYETGLHREQLFDLEADPGETVNLAPSSRYRDVLQEHRDRLRAWCGEVGDDFGYHYTHPRVPFMVPGDEYPADSGGLPEGFEQYSQPPAPE